MTHTKSILDCLIKQKNVDIAGIIKTLICHVYR